MRSIAIINQKGGVGKTTTAVNLGAALAEQGRRVLLLDIDPQANLTVHLDIDPTRLEQSIYDVLSNRAKLAEVILSRSGMDVAPSHIDLAGAEVELVGVVGRETILREAIHELLSGEPDQPETARSYDFLIIDCPPSLGLLALNALTSVEEVLIAMQTEFFALQGMAKLMDVVELVRTRLNPKLRLSAIVPCRFDPRTNLAKEVLDEMQRYFGEHVTRTRIRANVRLAEAPSHGKTIFEYDSDAKGCEDYRSLAREILGEAAETDGEAPAKKPAAAAVPEAVVEPAAEAAAEAAEAAVESGVESAEEPAAAPAKPADVPPAGSPAFEELPDSGLAAPAPAPAVDQAGDAAADAAADPAGDRGRQAET